MSCVPSGPENGLPATHMVNPDNYFERRGPMGWSWPRNWLDYWCSNQWQNTTRLTSPSGPPGKLSNGQAVA